MPLSPVVAQAWDADRRVTQALLEHLTPAMLDARTPGGGMTVAEHLAHVVGSTKYWGMELAPDPLGTLPDLVADDGHPGDGRPAGAPAVEHDLAVIRAVYADTSAAARSTVDAAPAGGRGSLPHPSGEAYLIHMMVHAAHHRGQILLALKTNGFALPDEDALWSPWKGG